MSGTTTPAATADSTFDLVIARVLSIGVNLSIGFLVVGVVLMAVNGISPLDPTWPPFRFGQLPADLVGLKPTGFIWAGLVLAVATPSLRVAASLVGYVRSGERGMALISFAILVVIGVSVVVAAGLGA